MNSFFATLLATAMLVAAAPTAAAPADKNVDSKTPNIYMIGDSTMAKNGGGKGTQGWGVYFPYSIKGATVINEAVAGRSARSYTTESRFEKVAARVKPGDYVLIEFGHNDAGSLSKEDNGRTDCGGAGNETCKTPAGTVVQTYVTYLTNAAKLMISKGAKVIISSPTPNNVCESGTCNYSPPRYTDYCKTVVKNVGRDAFFVDHGQYTANAYIKLDVKATDAFYPNDHTHTSPEGADVVAGAYVKGLLCLGKQNPLGGGFIKNSTDSVAGKCIDEKV